MKRYPEYKDSGVEWIGKIPVHWEIGRIKYFNEIIMGQSPSSEDYTENPNSLPFLQGNAEFGDHNPTPSIYCNTANKKALKNDILISVRAPVGAINVSDREYGIGRGLAAVRSIERYMFNYYYLSKSKNYLDSLSTGSTFTAITVEDLRNLPYPKIPIPEQSQIAAFLDHKTRQIDDLIEKKQKLIELLKEECTAFINHAVTKGLDPTAPMKDSGIEWLGEIPQQWEVKRLKFIANSVQTGNTPPSQNVEYYENPDTDWFTPSDFGDNLFLNDSNRKINSVSIKRGVSKLFNPYSVLIVGIGATLGKVGVIKHYSSSNQQINSIEFKDKMNPIFGAYYLRIFEPVVRNLSNAATLAILNQTNTKNIVFTCPPKDEQDKIVDFIMTQNSQVELAISRIEKEINLITEFKASLINETVTGKIDVRNYEIK